MKNIYLFMFASLLSFGSFAQYDTLGIDSIQWRAAADLGNCIEESRYFNDTVTVKGILITDGNRYGSSSHNCFIQMPGGGPWSGIHLRDNDGSGYTEEMVNLFAGWEVYITGYVDEYQGESEIFPLDGASIVLASTGNAISQDTITPTDLNNDQRNNVITTGEQWEGSYVRMENLEVVSVDFFAGNRVSFVVKDGNNNLVNVSDYFFVQKLPSYTHPTTLVNGSFVPPSVGDQFKALSGIVLHSKNDCPGASGRGYELHPFDSTHYEYGPSAPRISDVTRSPMVPTSAQTVTVTATIRDLDGTVTGANLLYQVGTDPSNTSFTTLSMTNTSGDEYSATIPVQSDGAFVRYYLEATDDSSNTTSIPSTDPTSSTYGYRVRDNGLTIYDLQFTPYSNGESVFRDAEVTVTGVVTASAQSDDLGYVYIQDENQLGGWAGIMATQNASLASLNRGDKVTITGTVNENSSNFTVLESVTNVVSAGTGSIDPMYFQPDTFTSYSFPNTEMYESMLIGLVNPTSLGNNKVHIVEFNSDAPSSFGEYRVGRDELDPNNGCRVLAGRKTTVAFSSYNVSYVNDTNFFANMTVPGILISDTMHMDTLYGIMHYSFGNMKLLPRNNDDFVGINVETDTTDTSGTSLPQIYLPTVPWMNAYPVPASSELTIETRLEDQVHTIRIIDVQGREVFKRITNEGTSKIFLDSFESGSYFVELYDAQERWLQTEKILIE